MAMKIEFSLKQILKFKNCIFMENIMFKIFVAETCNFECCKTAQFLSCASVYLQSNIK